MRNKLKKIYRTNYKEIRKNMLPRTEEAIKKQTNKLIKNLILDGKLNGYLGIYWPLKDEIDLRSLKDQEGIPIALPASQENGNLNYHSWTTTPLKKDFCGIPAPIDEPILSSDKISLLLVPALAIDQHGYRLGYGGGFYDRLRSKPDWRSIPSLAILPNTCVSQNPLPVDSWDIPFDGWINENGGFSSIPKT